MSDPKGRASILIVDDKVEDLDVLSKMLGQHGYSVRPATSAKLALQRPEATAGFDIT
jgi:CheY-like chemotaxis protein